MTGINVAHLSYYQQKTCIIRDINLQILPGTLTCLIGPNGSGKSTLLKLLAGLLTPSTGTISLDTVPLHDYPRKTLAKKLSFLPQQSRLPPSLTVREFVALGRFCHQTWFSRTQQEDIYAIENAISLADLQLEANSPVTLLSGGEQQRARIALMLAQQAHYLLLDEPMSGLDLKQQRNLMTLLIHLQKEHGKTLIVILHDLHQVIELADHVVLLKKGHMLHQGHPDHAMNPTALSTLFDFSFDALRRAI